MIPITPEQATEILQRVTRIETYCEARCASVHQDREEWKEAIARLRADVERGQDRLEQKIDRLSLALAEKTDDLRERQWADRLKIAGGGIAGGGAGAVIMWLATRLLGGK